MKRIIATIFGVSLALGALAQSAFTIRRPENGAVVRETIKVRIPRSSIPAGGYVGIWLNDKFVEAVAPTDKGDVEDGMFIYAMDTKERGMEDGKVKIEAALYAPVSAEAARIVSKSSVTVTLDNHSSIKPPTGGFMLRYNFKPGREMIYTITERVGRSTLTEAQAKLGGRANDVSGDAENFRYLIGYDNALKGGAEGLIRMQAMPNEGKEYAILTTVQDQTPKRYYKDQMSPLYMMLTNTGHEVFGRAPYYFGMEGTAGRVTPLDLFAVEPLPALPLRGVQVGDSWNSSLTIPAIGDAGELYETLKLTKPTPARGTLQAIEYQNGEKCAHIHNAIAVSDPGTSGASVSQEEDFWISLDRGILLKAQRTIERTVRVKTEQQQNNFGFGGPSAGGPPGPGSFGPPRGGKGGDNGGDFLTGPKTLMQGLGGKGRRGRGGPPGAGGPPAGFGGAPSGFGGGATNNNTGNRAATTKIVRERIQSIMTLDHVIN